MKAGYPLLEMCLGGYSSQKKFEDSVISVKL